LALNDNATLVVGTAKFYTATYDSTTPVAMPADLLAPGVDFEEIGHTSLEDIFSISSDGGDTSTIGSIQNKALRTTRATRTETFNIMLMQFDAPALQLYYGSNSTVGTAGEIQVPTNPLPTTATFLAVFQDGDNVFGIYVPKAEIFRGDDLSIGDTESLAGLPLAVTPLAHATNTWTYSVTPLGVTTP